MIGEYAGSMANGMFSLKINREMREKIAKTQKGQNPNP